MSKQTEIVNVVKSMDRLMTKLKSLLQSYVEEAMVVDTVALPKKKEVAKEVAETKPLKKADKAPTGQAKKEGLRGPQVKVLAALADSKVGLSRKDVADAAQVDRACITAWVGSRDESKRLVNDSRYYMSLISLGYVVEEVTDSGDKDVYLLYITKEGRQALKQILAARAKAEKAK